MKDKLHMTIEGLLFASLLLAANIGLLSGQPKTEWMLLPAAVAQGEWWRLLLHPWVHVSVYHLLLDATAFLSLFYMLDHQRPFERWGILAAAWAGQTAAVWWGDPNLASMGLCGLSGVAHGLFAAVCLQWRRDPTLRQMGNMLLLGLLAKCIWEAMTGTVFLSFLHLGSVGTPLTRCHGGGVMGAIGAYAIQRRNNMQ
jgi:rhomboid family GlyGly-CTERM serine protease